MQHPQGKVAWPGRAAKPWRRAFAYNAILVAVAVGSYCEASEVRLPSEQAKRLHQMCVKEQTTASKDFAGWIDWHWHTRVRPQLSQQQHKPPQGVLGRLEEIGPELQRLAGQESQLLLTWTTGDAHLLKQAMQMALSIRKHAPDLERKFVVVALDPSAHKEIQAEGFQSIQHLPEETSYVDRMWTFRWQLLLVGINSGLSVGVADSDMLFFRSPLPLLRNDADLHIATDHLSPEQDLWELWARREDDLSSGFIAARPSEIVSELLSAFLNDHREELQLDGTPRDPLDQRAFNRFLRSRASECSPCVLGTFRDRTIDLSEALRVPADLRSKRNLRVSILDPNDVVANGENFFWRRDRRHDSRAVLPAVVRANGVGPNAHVLRDSAQHVERLAEGLGVDARVFRTAAERSFSALVKQRGPHAGGLRRPQTERFIYWQRDKAGFNNLKLQLASMVAMAAVTGRTLVIADPEDGTDHLAHYYEFDFFDALKLSSVVKIALGKWPDEQPLQVDQKLFDLDMSMLDPDRDWLFEKDTTRIQHFECLLMSERSHAVAAHAVFHGLVMDHHLDEMASSSLKLLGLSSGGFDCLHIRRGDFRKVAKEFVMADSDLSAILRNKLTGERTVLVVSDERPELELASPVIYANDSYAPDISQNTRVAIDMLMCARAKDFIGTPGSTFSNGIFEMRLREALLHGGTAPPMVLAVGEPVTEKRERSHCWSKVVSFSAMEMCKKGARTCFGD